MRILRRQCVLGITGVLASLTLQSATSLAEQAASKPKEPLDDPPGDSEKAKFKQQLDALPVTGQFFTSLQAIDEGMKRILVENEFPGASLVLIREGRLMLARGYGFADREAQRFASPHDLFRLASISKPITAVAVLKLVEQGRLSLTDKIWSLLALEKPKDERWKEITIQNLLDHSGGWDRDASFDAMFKSVEFAGELKQRPPADQWMIITAMLKRDLDFAPGAKYAYSNFGYCLLGRAIEQVTGEAYDAYVKREVLAPAGAWGMRLGATRQSDLAGGEVRYYDRERTGASVFAADLGQQVPTPYGCWNLEAMDAHGGWVSTALDLGKWGASLLRRGGSPILSQASLETMWGPSPGALGHTPEGKVKDAYYALGWNVRRSKETIVSHTGSLPGTSTLLLMHRESQTVWTALFNSRVGKTKDTLPSKAVAEAIGGWMESVKAWPVGDLFGRVM